MFRTIALLSAAAIAMLLAGCELLTGPPQTPSTSVTPTGIADRAGGQPAVRTEMLVSTKWLADNLSNPDVVILHMGRLTSATDAPGADRKSYETAHIPGAQFVAWGQIAVMRDGMPNELPPMDDLVKLVRSLGINYRTRVVLYDDQTGLPSARAFIALDYLGLGDRTAMLDGLWKKWQSEKRPVSTAEPTAALAVKPSNFVPRPKPEVILALTHMRDLVSEKTSQPISPVAIIDARPSAEYEGQKAGEGITRPGHIPGAANVFWSRNIVSDEMPVLKPVSELRAIYEKAGATPGGLVVTYCRTGGQASHAYFVARYLGYDVRLFDGSFWEWSKAKDTEVVGPGGTSKPDAGTPVSIHADPRISPDVFTVDPAVRAQIEELMRKLDAETQPDPK